MKLGNMEGFIGWNRLRINNRCRPMEYVLAHFETIGTAR